MNQDVFDFLDGFDEILIPPPGITVDPDGRKLAWCFDGPSRKFVQVEVRLHGPTQSWVRRDTFDVDSVKECIQNYARLQCKGKRVLDLGANVGGFSRIAIEQGAVRVVAVEPCPYNFEILKMNSPASENLQVGVVPSGDGDMIDFTYATSKRNSVSSSTEKRMNASDVSIKVPARSILSLLNEIRPQVLKCDIEGGEYGLLDAMGEIPDYVEQAAFEFHKGSEPWKGYPARFFPADRWEMHEDNINRFGGLRDLTFLRK